MDHDLVGGETETPHVTVCVPVRNGGRTIRRTLESILGQDYPDIEIIVCDNCSTDDTAQIVQEYAGRGVFYYLNPRLDAYAESNWNHALSIASGPLVSVYHADDLYSPTIVRRQAEFLQAHPHVSAVFTMMQRIDDEDRAIRMGSTKLPDALSGQVSFDFEPLFNAVLEYGNFMVVPTMMARKAALDAVGGFRWEQFASASDIDLYLRLAKWGPIGIIDEPLHRYRVSAEHGSAIVSRFRTSLADFFIVMDNYLGLPEMQALTRPQSRALYGLQRAADRVLCAMNLLAQDKAVEARTHLTEAMHARHFMTGVNRPRLLAWLVLGICFRASLYAGLGRPVASVVQRAQRWKLRRGLEPVGR